MVSGPLDFELSFTEVYKKYKNEHQAIREIMCLKEQFKYYFDNIQKGDLFAGRVRYPLVGFGLETTTGGSLFYCKKNAILKKLDISNVTNEYKNKVLDMITFWEEEAFIDHEVSLGDKPKYGKMIKRLPKEILDATSNYIADMGGRLAGTNINFGKLLKKGIPGLYEEVLYYKEQKENKNEDSSLYKAMLMSLDIIKEVMLRYAEQALEMSENEKDENIKNELINISKILNKLANSKPETLREALQLVWIYAMAAQTVNFGRMDVYLGDFYVNDLNRKIITQEQALKYLQEFWKMIVARRIAAHEPGDFNGRIIIGGKGRSNEENADKFALLAMEASRTVIETEPQLSLRFYEGMNPDLMKKALDVIGEGRIYPMLYNDDVNIPAVSKAFGIDEKDAEQYLPYGCGEYNIDYKAIGSPNCSLNLLKALEVALHNGKDPLTGNIIGLQTGDINQFDTFEKLYDSYKKQVEFYIEMLAKRHKIEYEVEAKNAAFVLVSLLYDNCLEKGKSVVEGGAKYTGGIIESFGLVNTGDSLAAIKKLVYEEKKITLEQLVEALDNNFEGFDDIRKMCLETPKYGNDDDYVDFIVKDVSNHMCEHAKKQAKKINFDYFLVVNINNYYNVRLGNLTSASADGRKKGEPLANGNNPTAGRDKNGITAFLNSLTKINSDNHAGYVQNMKFSKTLFNEQRPKVEALLKTYFKKGGTQAMITVVNKGDLENAMKEPEKYQNLIVRVGGFSARFVELPKDVQIDVLNRTLY
ncbi:pyruvate formate lyase family protein [Caldicellulosiruptoraceae bacterium PP1]